MLRRLALAAAAAAAALVALMPGLAWAHAEVVSTYPGDGSKVAGALRQVGVRFDEAVELVPGALQVTTDVGSPVALDRPRLKAAGTRLSARMQDRLAPGGYRVAWRVRADDGHIETGVFGFRIAAAAGPGAGPARAGAPLFRPGEGGDPVWPIVVAAILAGVAIGGAGLVVVRGLRALREPVVAYPNDPQPTSAPRARDHAV